MTSVKICGLRTYEDAIFAINAGADYLGFVFAPDSPRYVGSNTWNPEWLSGLNIPKVAVYGEYAGDVPDSFDYVQAVRWQVEPSDQVRAIRVIRIGDPDVSRIDQIRAGDAILLDRFEPGSFGGSGVTADWEEAAQIVSRLTAVKVFLAGGLTPENVLSAIEIVRPFGVDVSSGVELERGVKDYSKIELFLNAVKKSGSK